jgi:hypothetical protein
MNSKRVMIFLIILLAMAVFAGCSDNDPPTGPTGPAVPAGAVGTWEYTAVEVNSVPVALSVALSWTPSTVRETITSGADGSYTNEEWDVSGAITREQTGTIQIIGAVFTLTVTMEDGQPMPIPEIDLGGWALVGSTLTVTVPRGPDTVVSTFVKQ